MRTLGLDLETYSSVDLAKSGVYAYASAPDFELLLLAYAFDEDEVQVVDLASGEPLPGQVLEALYDDRVIKTAFNANFERTCLAVYLKHKMPPSAWRCTAVQAAMLGLPLSLEGVAKVMNLEEQKLREGKDLIRYFSTPCKPTNANGGRVRNRPLSDPEKWQLFKLYCRRDVEVERAIRTKLQNYPIPDQEQELWVLDQQINDQGIRVDETLVHQALACDQTYQLRLHAKAQSLTGLTNPNSVGQLKAWLGDQGLEVEDLAKKTVAELVGRSEGEVAALLRLRQDMAKTSIKKYEAIRRSVGGDGRVRGLFQFYGANRTGRWAGRLVQVQNLPQSKLSDLGLARELVRIGQHESLEWLFESVPSTLSQLIRTAFIPSRNHRFIVADFSAIEARVIAWLAGEQWRLDVFSGHGKIYEASASQMFQVPLAEITKTSPLRQKGKVAELALGYQGGPKALLAMGALEMGLQEEELAGLVQAWRQANSRIVNYWHAVESAAKKAVGEQTPSKLGGVSFQMERGILWITLPSGRKLSYLKARLEIDPRFNRECLTYEGMNQGSKRWTRLNTYGGKLVENITQAIARDCLAFAMLRLAKAGYPIVMHVHDEVVIDAPQGFGSIEEVCTLMGAAIPWAEGLPLRAEGFEAEFYRK